MKFLCSGCGACCRRIGEINKAQLSFGKLPDRGDGVCANLNKDNSCSVYENRPLICRVKDLGKAQGYTDLKQWYILNTKSCHSLIDEDGLDSKYKVDIKEYDLQ